MFEEKKDTYEYKGENIEFTYKVALTAIEKIGFVTDASSLVCMGGHYYSPIKDLVFDYNIIKYFTDIKLEEVSEFSLDNLTEIEEFLMETDVVDTVKKNALFGVIEELEDGLNDNIENITGIHIDNISTAIRDLVNSITDKLNQLDSKKLGNALAKAAKSLGDINSDTLLEAYKKSGLHEKVVKE